jgi:hypothetical protein
VDPDAGAQLEAAAQGVLQQRAPQTAAVERRQEAEGGDLDVVADQKRRLTAPSGGSSFTISALPRAGRIFAGSVISRYVVTTSTTGTSF